LSTFNQIVPIPNSTITLEIKREDLIHPSISGNKFRKLKYNLIEAKANHYATLLTFGGAFSNHIAAVASAGREYDFKTIGVIRGEELEGDLVHNPTLRFAQQCGMQLVFVSRKQYRSKTDPAFLKELVLKYGDYYYIPEGGTNALAVLGCEEILGEDDEIFDFICCSVGTGGTISGLINSSKSHQKIIGFPALNGDFLKEEICKFAANDRWELILDYAFGGYGKVSKELIFFINRFFTDTGIPLDPIYTGKMVFGVMDLIRQDYFPKDSKILMIHTGGLQGIEGMNMKLKKLNSPLLIKDV
jgi:1-aminocyclopropane-1-carboxylate deaminase